MKLAFLDRKVCVFIFSIGPYQFRVYGCAQEVISHGDMFDAFTLVHKFVYKKLYVDITASYHNFLNDPCKYTTLPACAHHLLGTN